MSNLYLTPAEFANAPTAIDTTNIVPGGTAAQNTAELTNMIARASSWIDMYCQQPSGLGATVNTETIDAHLNRQGFLRIHPYNTPIIQLTSLQYRLYPQAGWNLIDLSTVQIFPRWFEAYNFFSYFGLFWPNLPMPYMPQPMGSPYQPYTTPTQASYIQDIPLIVQYTYINGWPNTVLNGNVSVGATTITVADATGVIAGTTLTIYDGSNTETITVASITNNTLTLNNPLIFAHTSGVAVSALPAAIKEACILVCSYFLKERGVNSITLEGVQNPLMQKYDDKTDLELAKEILRPYRRII